MGYKANYRVTAEAEEANRWVLNIDNARRKGYKSYKEAYDAGKLHQTFITNEVPVLFIPHANFWTN